MGLKSINLRFAMILHVNFGTTVQHDQIAQQLLYSQLYAERRRETKPRQL